jgi:hypothetical protein
MNGISINSSIDLLWNFFSKCIESLSSLFAKSIFIPKASLQEGLSSRGVENLGNTCVFSSLLQELAFCYEYYACFFEKPLEKESDETEEHFVLRQALQGLLKSAVLKLQKEEIVSKEEVRKVFSTLIDLDCGDIIDAGSQISRRILGLYVYSHMDSQKLWHRMLCFLGETNAILDLEGETFIGNSLLQNDRRMLCRVAVRDGTFYPEEIKEEGRSFTQKLVYVCERKHMTVFCKQAGGWIHYDDEKLGSFKEVSWKDVCMVVYDSIPILKSNLDVGGGLW